MDTAKKVRFATIGTGKIVRRFLSGAAKCGALEYEAVYSRDAEKAQAFAGEYGAHKWYTSLEALAEDEEVDGVYIASPNFLHCEQAVLMMEHGKHVLCEKPVASNSRELALMLETAEKNQVVFLEAMRSVFAPGFSVIKENLHRLGAIRRATFQYCQYSSRYDNFKNGIIENAFKPELSNGALMDIGVYCVYALALLFGMPKEILAQGVFLENGVDGAGTIIGLYDEMQAEMIYSKITDSSLPSQIQGELGNMIITQIAHVENVKICYRDGRVEEFPVEMDEADMRYEAGEWARLILEEESAEEYNRCSVMEMKIMDEAREKMGIVFPADSKQEKAVL